MSQIQPRHPRNEASALLPPGHEARVLEPSPPANTDPAWFADDPTDPAGANGTVVTPIPREGVTWDEMADQAGVAHFAADHWLDGRRRLESLPAGYDAARQALHQVAFFVLAPMRHSANGKLGLRYTYRGFGTPFFGGQGAGDEQVRIEGDLIIHQVGDSVSSHQITTLDAAVGFLGFEYRDTWFDGFHDPLAPLGPSVVLDVDPTPSEAIGAWLGFATNVLERARRTPGAADVSRIQLWPEHFDPAFEMGDSERGHRASYGASPGDEAHPSPYLYIAPWGEVDRTDPYWNDPHFAGASLAYAQLLEAEDPYRTALDFIEAGFKKLTA